MSHKKILKQIYIQCANCNWIVLYKRSYRYKIIVRKERFKICSYCNSLLDKSGKRYTI